MKEGIIKILGVGEDFTTNNRASNDFYSTDPQAVKELLKYENFSYNILEPMVGTGVISEVLKEEGNHNIISMDIIDRGYPNTIIQDFFKYSDVFEGDIISNPPYKEGWKYVLHEINHCNGKVAMLVKIQFLETITRYEKIFKNNPPTTIYCFVKRISCYKNGDYERYKNKGSAMCFCWVIWDHNNKHKTTEFKWISNHKS